MTDNNKNNHHHNHDCDCGHDHNHDHNHDHDCDCGHDHHHHHEEEVEVIHLTLDDDTELICYVVGVFDVEDLSYIALVPEDDERVLLYRYEEIGDEIELSNIEDDEEFNTVSEAYYELFENDEDEDYEEEE